jgi:hypothetical protein
MNHICPENLLDLQSSLERGPPPQPAVQVRPVAALEV